MQFRKQIEGLQTPSNSVKFGNTIICKPTLTCFGTNNDDIIYGGANELVFALGGITSVLSRLEIARRNIIVASSLFDNKNRSPTAEYTGILYVYEPLNSF
jgi:hypothetical protein